MISTNSPKPAVQPGGTAMTGAYFERNLRPVLGVTVERGQDHIQCRKASGQPVPHLLGIHY